MANAGVETEVFTKVLPVPTVWIPITITARQPQRYALVKQRPTLCTEEVSITVKKNIFDFTECRIRSIICVKVNCCIKVTVLECDSDSSNKLYWHDIKHLLHRESDSDRV